MWGYKMMNKPLVIAHRGASAYAPENTLIAIKKAVNMGADGIEIDVQLLKDGHVVVIHDTRVNRTSNGNGRVRSLTLSQLKSLDFGSWFSKEFKNEPICTLEEVFDYLKGWKGLINIEIKRDWLEFSSIEKKVAELIAKFDMRENAIISSFNTYCTLKLKLIDKDINTGILYPASSRNSTTYARFIKVNAIHPWFENVTETMVRSAHKYNLKINAYTLDNPHLIKNLAIMGVDGIITNVPDTALDILNEMWK